MIRSFCALSRERDVLRKWTVYVLICGFLAALGACLVPDSHASPHDHGSSMTIANCVSACNTSVVPSESQSGYHTLLIASSATMKYASFHEDMWFTPPSPPPRP